MSTNNNEVFCIDIELNSS